MKCGDPNNPSGPYLKSDGMPCRRDCAPGLTRCNLHGATVAAKIKAETMLAQARLPALEALYRLLEKYESDECAACGFPKGDAEDDRLLLSAIKTILDRTGMGPRATVELVKQSDGDVDINLATDAERESLIAHLAEIRAIKSTIRDRQTGVGPTKMN